MAPFVPTSLPRHTDGDYVGDFEEVHGRWCYNGETNCGTSDNSARITNATVVDSDVDGMRAAERTERAGGSPAFAVAHTAMYSKTRGVGNEGVAHYRFGGGHPGRAARRRAVRNA